MSQKDWKNGSAAYHNELDKRCEAMAQNAVPTTALESMDLRAVYQRLMASPFVTWKFQNQ